MKTLLRIKVRHRINNWEGRINDTDGLLTQVEWLKDGSGNYTNITSWVLSEDLVAIDELN